MKLQKTALMLVSAVQAAGVVIARYSGTQGTPNQPAAQAPDPTLKDANLSQMALTFWEEYRSAYWANTQVIADDTNWPNPDPTGSADAAGVSDQTLSAIISRLPALLPALAAAVPALAPEIAILTPLLQGLAPPATPPSNVVSSSPSVSTTATSK